ncbi:hypothetical protein EDD37DRAFT_282195 [Exophiala viscosa]|uniref:Uncharacterized protein n=1 Tax=Exophiala viscosa TaxID=2486360 RepID=A0AAN6IIK7_9EURO|nr:hypothetical protein EDD36DRAFT_414445 [Exophiala viscosa]KAI1627920.1 hypothetical protein EDD37DRAFT_282195 [Exophiala viscosa]
MVAIPILVSTPGLHTAPAQEAHEFPFLGGANSCPATSYYTMVSHATQTDSEDESPETLVPVNSRTESPTRKRNHFSEWTQKIHNRLASPEGQRAPVATESSGSSHLAPPASPGSLGRPSTPAADLYEGQSDEAFGMTFEHPQHPHFHKGQKPVASAHNYEDHKHRMLMDWVERRNSC